MRLDTNYYYWPGSWVQNRPGFMTGSGMPMRFADPTGTMLDIYQAATQMTDESDQTYPFTPNTLLDNALGPLGYYGAFTANMHTDAATIPQNDALMASAQARGVPIVSGKQLLTWIDGRNASSYGDVAWSANTLTFKVLAGAGATGLTGMLPTAGPNGTQLTGVTRGGSAVTYRTETVKGLEYAIFPAAAGSYSAAYAAPQALTVAALSVDTGPAVTDQTASLQWTTTSVATSEISLGTSTTKLTTTKAKRDATRKHSVSVSGLKPGTRYYYRVTSRDAKGVARTSPALTEAPASFVTPAEDAKKPTATAPVVTPLPDGTARVEWSTSEPATGAVRTGRSAGKLSVAAADSEASRTHSLVVTGMAPDSTYWIQTTSTDPAGNVATGKPARVTTPSAGVAEQQTASFRRGRLTGAAVVDPAGSGAVTLSGKQSGKRQGTFTSGLLDAQAMVDWDRAVSSTVVPKGSAMELRVRTGSTASPDSSWSSWKTVSGKGRVKGSSRFLQYEVVLTSKAGAAAPELRAFGVTANGGEITHPGETR
jgi:chitodextrinase